MLMLADCSNCRTPFQLPPGAKSIRCALCHAITCIADPRALPPPTTTTSTYHHPPPPPPQAPSPYYQAPGQPPSASSQKRAVIIGISYERSRNELKGCVNYAKCMKYMLVNKFNFPESYIVMLAGSHISWTSKVPYVCDIKTGEMSRKKYLVHCSPLLIECRSKEGDECLEFCVRVS